MLGLESPWSGVQAPIGDAAILEAGTLIVALGVAAGIGLMVGMERQLHARSGTVAAGARTYALYTVWGVAAGYLGVRFGPGAFVVAAVVLAVLVVTFYIFASRATEDWGTTSELAALTSFFLGVLIADGELAVAVGAAVLLVVLLRSKEALHDLADRFSDEDVRVVLQFAVVTAVVLPLLPARSFGPFEAINPREIWSMVAVVAAIGLAGYVALRMWGERGIGAAGLLGGLVSSTAVALSYGRLAGRQPGLARVAGAAVVAASGIMYLRVVAEALAVEPALAARIGLPAGLLGAGLVLVALRPLVRTFREEPDGTQPTISNPVSLGAALTFGAVYGLIALTAAALRELVGEGSLVAVGAVSGLVDVDAITLLMANRVSDGLDAGTGGLAVMMAASVNTLVKAGLAGFFGGRALLGPVISVLIPAAAIAAAAGFML